MIKIIRRCQNSRNVEGFHPLFHESVARTTLCGCLWAFCGCLWVFVGVRGVTICDYLAQTCPWDHLARRKKKIYCIIINDRDAVTFVNLTLTFLHVFWPFIYSTHNIYVHIAHGMPSNSTSPPIQLVPKFRTICWRSVSGSSGRHLYDGLTTVNFYNVSIFNQWKINTK